MFWVYAIVNPDGKIYIGQTDDVERRVAQHNAPAGQLTRTTKRFRGPWRLFYSEPVSSRTEALVRERQLKSSRGRAFLKSRLAAG
jgi:predicted GIY-YIG superfamily endonuclease